VPFVCVRVRWCAREIAPQVNSLSYGMAEINVDTYLGKGYFSLFIYIYCVFIIQFILFLFFLS
jgi:hypothetical protein